MVKKLSLLLAALAAVFAFAAPAASAAPALTMPPGVLVPKGTKITGTSVNTVVKTPFGAIKCEKWTVNAEVIANGGFNVEAVGGAQGAAVGCTVNGIPILVTDVTLKKLSSAIIGKGMVALTFEVDVPGVCHYESGAIPYAYAPGAAVIQLAGKLLGKPAACEPAEFEGAYELETTVGGGAVIHD